MNCKSCSNYINHNDCSTLHGICTQCRKKTHKICSVCNNFTINDTFCICKYCIWESLGKPNLKLYMSCKPSSKSFSHECPCGITRSMCDYHKV